MGRAQTGVGLAGLALTAAVLAADCPTISATFVGLTALILIGTGANRLPHLHRLPLLGAPNASVVFRLEGQTDLKAGIWRIADPQLPQHLKDATGWIGPALEARTVHLEVGVSNQSRATLSDAAVTFMHPEGIHHAESDAHGQATNHGRWMPPTSESLISDDDGRPIWSDYWVWRGDIPRGSLLLYFKLTFADAGNCPIRAKVSASDLYREYKLDDTIRIDEVPRDHGPARDRLSYAIQECEEWSGTLARRDAASDRSRVMTLIVALRQAIPDDRPELHERVSGAKAAYNGPKVGPEYEKALLDAKVRAAYDVRRRLGEGETSE